MSLFLRVFFIQCFLPLFLLGQPADFESHRPHHFPDPPIPAKRMFFLQRNLDANTVMYDLNYTIDNQIDIDEPLDVFYISYADDGQRRELNWIERKFAYGYSSKSITGTEEIEISLHAYNKRKIRLIKDGKRYIPIMEIKGKRAKLTNLFVQADESGIWPKVQFIEIFGKDLVTGEQVFEKFYP